MLGIDGHFEGILSEINFGDVNPLTVYVVFVNVITSDGDAWRKKRWKRVMKY